MKINKTGWLVILILIGVCLCDTANCATHHVWGSLGDQRLFNNEANAPLSMPATNEFGSVSAQTTLSSFYEFDVFSCSAVAAVEFDYWGAVWADSRAEIFIPFTGTGFEIHLGSCGVYEPPYGGYWKIEIKDMTPTIPTTVWIKDPLGGNLEGFYEINPNHLYQLQIYAGATTQEYNGTQAEVYLNVIPEPCTLLLLGLGGFGLLDARKSKRVANL